MTGTKLEKDLKEVMAVAFLRGIDVDGNSVKIATKNVTDSIGWYGAEWDTTVSSPDGTRIGNMNLHRLLPIQNLMHGCLLDDNGNEVQLLNASSWLGQDRSGTSGQVMVAIPNFYFRLETDGNKFRMKMLDQVPTTGKTFAGWYQFFPNTVEYVYVSAYEAALDRTNSKLCSIVNTSAQFRGGTGDSSWDNTYRSLLGRPVTNLSRGTFRSYARNRNTSNTYWNEYLYTAHVMLAWLFYVEYNTLDSQKDYNAQLDANGFKQGGLGKGVSDIPDWGGYNSYNPFVPCGASDSLGNRTGVFGYNVLASDGTSTYYTAQVPRYRGVENPFGHIWKWCDGLNIKEDGTTRTAYVATATSKFSDTAYDGYENRGIICHDNGNTTKMLLGAMADLLPTSIGGSSSTYWCDHYWVNAAVNLYGARLGGSANDGSGDGFGCVTTTNVPAYAHASIGSRLCFVKC